MICFVDTSALVKLYHRESGTQYMDRVFRDQASTLLISELTIVEWYSALSRKVRMGEISPEAADAAAKRFETDCVERFILLMLDSSVLAKAKDLISRHGKKIAIRTLDAIQLAVCQNQKDPDMFFFSSDHQLSLVCSLESIPFLNPEKPSR